MPRPRSIVLVLIACSLFAPDAARVRAQTTADLFNSDVIHDVHIFINSRDLRELYERYTENTSYPADLVWGGLRVRNVAVRSRGTGSRNNVKIGLQVDFDRYTRGQRFLGLANLVLDNMWQDASMMRERLAVALFDRMGQPAPRESFCRLFINNVLQGLYAIVEPIDEAFLARTGGRADDYLFEYHYQTPFYGEYLGDDLAPYKARFEPRTHELDPDALVYGPIREMFREINGPDDAVWRERVEERIDLAQLVSQVAIEAFLSENDGYLGYAGMNTFYLSRPADSARHRWLPWDRDFAFTFLDSSIFRETGTNAIMARALAQPDLRALYLDELDRTAAVTLEEDWLAGLIDRTAALIAPVALADSRKNFSNQEFLDHVEFLREFARTRPAFVRDEVARSRGEASREPASRRAGRGLSPWTRAKRVIIGGK
jgi:hypothetical protein